MEAWLAVSIAAFAGFALHFILGRYQALKTARLSQIATLTAEKLLAEREASLRAEDNRRLQDENLQLRLANLSLHGERLLKDRELREALNENQKQKQRNDELEEKVLQLAQERDDSRASLQGKSIEYVVWFLNLLLRVAGMGISR